MLEHHNTDTIAKEKMAQTSLAQSTADNSQGCVERREDSAPCDNDQECHEEPESQKVCVAWDDAGYQSDWEMSKRWGMVM
jgi:hypothetical protein